MERHLRELERHALGDLDEDYAARVRPAHGRLFSELWYLREASTLVFAIVRDRWAQRWRIRRSESKDTWGGDMTGIGRDGANALRGLLRFP